MKTFIFHGFGVQGMIVIPQCTNVDSSVGTQDHQPFVDFVACGFQFSDGSVAFFLES